MNSRSKTLSHIQSQVDMGDVPNVCRERVLYCKAVAYHKVPPKTVNRASEGRGQGQMTPPLRQILTTPEKFYFSCASLFHPFRQANRTVLFPYFFLSRSFRNNYEVERVQQTYILSQSFLLYFLVFEISSQPFRIQWFRSKDNPWIADSPDCENFPDSTLAYTQSPLNCHENCLACRRRSELHFSPWRAKCRNRIANRLTHRNGQHQRRFAHGFAAVDRIRLRRVLQESYVENSAALSPMAGIL